jgi:hypothetical protein
VDWKGKPNPLVEAVKAISITGDGPEKSREELELEAMRGERVADSWEQDPRNPANRKPDRNRLVKYGPEDDDVVPAWVIEGDDVADENREGSYEALMAGWGGSGRRAFSNEIARE